MTNEEEVLGTARANHEAKVFRGAVETYGLDAAASILANSTQGRRLGRPPEFWAHWHEAQQHLFKGDIDVEAAENEALERLSPITDQLAKKLRSPTEDVNAG
jgi:hypothetical protein